MAHSHDKSGHYVVIYSAVIHTTGDNGVIMSQQTITSEFNSQYKHHFPGIVLQLS